MSETRDNGCLAALRVISGNAYRVLGLPADASYVDVQDAADTIRRHNRLRRKYSTQWDLPWLDQPDRSDPAVRDAVGRLRNPLLRIKERFFWFGKASESLISASPAELPPATPSAPAYSPNGEHDTALLMLLHAAFLDSHIHDQRRWLACLAEWAQVVRLPEYWEYLLQVEDSSGFEPRATDDEHGSLRDGALRSVIDVPMAVVLDALRLCNLECTERVLSLLCQSALPRDVVSYAYDQVTGDFEDSVEASCDAISRSLARVQRTADPPLLIRQSNKRSCDEAARRFSLDVEPKLSLVSALSHVNSDVPSRVRDRAAECLFTLAASYTWADDFRATSEILVKALVLAPTDSRTREDIQVLHQRVFGVRILVAGSGPEEEAFSADSSPDQERVANLLDILASRCNEAVRHAEHDIRTRPRAAYSACWRATSTIESVLLPAVKEICDLVDIKSEAHGQAVMLLVTTIQTVADLWARIGESGQAAALQHLAGIVSTGSGIQTPLPLHPQLSDNVAASLDEIEPYAREVRPWLRYWARMFDLTTGSALAAFLLNLMLPSQSRRLIPSVLAVCISLILFEACLIARYGTTPGKWLLGISVVRTDGRRIPFRTALGRTFWAATLGSAFGMPILSFVTCLTSYERLTQQGITAWDEAYGIEVSHKKVGACRLAIAVVCVISLFTLTTGRVNSSQDSQTPTTVATSSQANRRADIDRLKTRIADERKTVEYLESVLRHTRDDLDELAARMDALKKEIDRFEQQHRLGKAINVTDYEQAVDTYNTMVPQYNGLLSEYDNTLGSLRQSIDAHNQMVGEHNSMIGK